jgi:chromate transporter
LPAAPSLTALTRRFLQIGLLSFGGPAAQIALMHRVLVEETRWLSEKRFLDALSFCMLLPGPEAMQLATYAGWRLRGVAGGLIAGGLFVAPGALIILALGWIYAVLGNLPLVEALFLGIKAAVLIIVIEALVKLARRAFRQRSHFLLAIGAFVALFFFDLPFPLVIFVAALWGALVARSSIAAPDAPAVAVRVRDTVLVLGLGAALWLAPLGLLALLPAPPILTDIALFFSKLAIVTFGGAYAVLAYMAQQVVTDFGWLSAGQMLDGLGLAETTPGPLILVTEFVGFLAGLGGAGGVMGGVTAALLTLWATFVPCFVLIFAGAPYIDWITAQPRLNGALMAITATVVGVIANLSVWFGLHVLFREVRLIEASGLTLWVPRLSTLDWQVLVLALLAALCLRATRLPVTAVLALAAAGGWVLSLI